MANNKKKRLFGKLRNKPYRFMTLDEKRAVVTRDIMRQARKQMRILYKLSPEKTDEE